MHLSLRLFLIIVALTVYPRISVADNSKFDQQLADIQRLDDKALVLSELATLMQSADLVASQKFSVHLAIMFTYHELNDLDKALAQAQKSQEFASNVGLKKEVATAHKMIGAMHYYRGENKAAIVSYERALEIFIEMELPVYQANLHNNMALVYTTTGEIAKALQAYQTAEPLYQKYGDEEDKIDIRYNIAGLHIRLKKFDIAIDMLHEVIEKRLQMSDDEDLASAYADIGVAYKQARQFKNAEHYMNKAMDYYLGQKNFYQVTSQYQNLSDLYNISGEYEKAYDYALKTIELSQKVGHKKAFVGGLYTHATSLFQQGQLDDVIEQLALSTQKGQEINYKPQIIENLGLSALALAGKQDFTKSLKVYREYLHEKHKLVNLALDQQLAQFEVQQLTNQVQELEQNKKFQLLEQKQQRQAWKNTVFASVAGALLIFFLYRRHAFNRLKQDLEVKVKQRTMELEVANKRLTELSFLDGMTALYNRRSFDVDMAEAWQRQAKDGEAFQLVIASVDMFHQFNSNHGHLAGDDLLKKIAALFRKHVRSQDRVYRFTGSEFAVLCLSCEMTVATELFEDILSKVAALDIPHDGSDYKVVTMSAGICQSDDHVLSTEQLIDRVDQRLYIAKKTGRNQVINQVVKAT
ncbi:tetratricopeptide repeat-containing diguanylate cyclase [Thalassotalea atypica]|uniref:tetratricopeptide repeat-containing diguanylate cyclase n=1 Tax=Thalassotalea atypica TaxID=2054316 RepID=UPI0025727EF2|nr:tetratricopeptide repeat-containing diguanylate cyclase [Thalassotalea atypica]